MDIGIAFGALSEPIKKQLNEQGYTLENLREDKFEKLRKSILMLGFHGYISDSQQKKCFQKLIKEIIKEAKEL